MLAGTEETLHRREPLEVNGADTAIEALLAGLIDYAGLYPPASLDMHSAVENYRKYRAGPHAIALGRFIVDIKRVDELRAVAGKIEDLKLSVIISQPAQLREACKLLDDGVPIEALEGKAASPHDVEQMTRSFPANIEAYVEIPIADMPTDLLRAISDAGARAKLRMGGVMADAFPSADAVARALEALTRAKVAFKATAGLHHPIRSRHPLTYAQDSPCGMMHGFINLICAATLLHSGASVAEAKRALAEEDPAAWSLTPQSLAWRSLCWSTDRLSKTRKEFVSFGSCSFEEPMRDLEALGWL